MLASGTEPGRPRSDAEGNLRSTGVVDIVASDSFDDCAEIGSFGVDRYRSFLAKRVDGSARSDDG